MMTDEQTGRPIYNSSKQDLKNRRLTSLDFPEPLKMTDRQMNSSKQDLKNRGFIETCMMVYSWCSIGKYC